MKRQVIEPKKIKTELPCPGCGDQALAERWQKDNTTYETVDCQKCAVEYGRVNQGTWHCMGELGPDVLKISWRAHGAIEIK